MNPFLRTVPTRLALAAFIAALGLASLPTHARDPSAPRFSTEKISLIEWNEFRTEVRSMPDVRCQELASNQTKCEASARNTVWLFTREGHPAHPAVTRRVLTVLQSSGGNAVLINRTGHYAGDVPAYRAWMKELSAADEQQVTAAKASLDGAGT